MNVRGCALVALTTIAVQAGYPQTGPTTIVQSEYIFERAPFPSAHASTIVGGPFLGMPGYYDYSDSGIRDTAAGTETHWWCGDLPGHTTDTILQEQYRLSDWSVTIPERQVLAEGPAGSWDSWLTCNPSVVRGQFVNPFGDGLSYTYAMYYVGIADVSTGNSIGAAFSDDGTTWRKYPTPVLTFPDPGHGYYGYAQPNATVINGRVELLFEESDAPATPGPGPIRTGAASRAGAVAPRSQVRHALGADPVPAVSTHWYTFANSDGVTFAGPALIPAAGLPSPTPSWGAAAYDPQDGRWYATFNALDLPASITGGVPENGQPGVALYATDNLDTGTWTQLDTVDTVVTGSEANFIAGILRDPNGDVSSAFLPSVRLDVSQSWPRPAYNAYGAALGNSGAFNQWQIAWHQWTPGQPWRTLARVDYAGGHHEVTTGWWDSSVYHLEAVSLGKLAEAPTGVASVPVYLCKAAATDYVDTLRADCNGWYQAGLLGYISPTPGVGLIPIYSCISAAGHFVSPYATCEGQAVDPLEPAGLLGYSQT